MLMKGWKTWLSVAALVLYGVYQIVVESNFEQGYLSITGGLAALGIGHKIEKNK